MKTDKFKIIFKIKNKLFKNYLILSKSIGRYSFIYRNNIMKVPKIEPTKPPKKLIYILELPISVFWSSSFLKSVESTTFKR